MTSLYLRLRACERTGIRPFQAQTWAGLTAMEQAILTEYSRIRGQEEARLWALT